MLLRPDLSASPTGWHACSSRHSCTRRVVLRPTVRYAPLTTPLYLLLAAYSLPPTRYPAPDCDVPRHTLPPPSASRLTAGYSCGLHAVPTYTYHAKRQPPHHSPLLRPSDAYRAAILRQTSSYHTTTIHHLLCTPFQLTHYRPSTAYYQLLL